MNAFNIPPRGTEIKPSPPPKKKPKPKPHQFLFMDTKKRIYSQVPQEMKK